MGVDIDNGSELSSRDTKHMESYGVFVGVWRRGHVDLHISPKFSKISRKCFEKSEKILHRTRCWTLQKEA